MLQSFYNGNLESFSDLRCYLFTRDSKPVTTMLMHLSEYHKYTLGDGYSIFKHLCSPL